MPPEVISSIQQLRERVEGGRRTRQRVGFVPTMGALHAGHESLMNLARRDCDLVIVSIFVNPLQFDRADDLDGYPRTLDVDVALCGAASVDVVFAPTADEMYPRPPDCFIEVGHVAEHLCGPFRPGHFRGVATVVMKLLQIARPDRAYFGEKDAQQLAVVRRMVSDFNVPVEIVGAPTVREADGLAISSRNRHLSPDERLAAPVLFQALDGMRRQIAGGATAVADVRSKAAALIARRAGVALEYLEVVEPDDMQPVTVVDRPVVAAGAVWVGQTRLIDNVRCVPPS